MSSNADQSAGASLSRRRFIQASGAGAAAAALPAGASAQDGNETDTGDGETGAGFSFPENTITSENTGGAHAVLTQALGEAEIEEGRIGSLLSGDKLSMETIEGPTNDVPALIQQSILMLERSQQNDETFLSQLYNMMNRARTFALVRGKSVAIQNINNGATEQETIDGAGTEVDEQYTLIQSNYLNGWTTRANRVQDQQNKLEDAGSVNVFGFNDQLTTDGDGGWRIQEREPVGGYSYPSLDVKLADGSTKTIPQVKATKAGEYDYEFQNPKNYTASLTASPVSPSVGVSLRDSSDPISNYASTLTASTLDADPTVESMWAGYNKNLPSTKSEFDDQSSDWEDIDLINQWAILWDWIEQQHEDVKANIQTYAEEAYAAVDAGEIDVEGLVANSPAVMAQEWSTDYDETGHYSFAAASLGASGVAYDYEHEMVISLEDGSTLRGTMFVNSEQFSFTVGETVNPNGVPGTIYFAYSSEDARRELEPTGDYRTSVEGGQVRIRTDPVQGAEYLVETAAGERATIQGSEFEPTDPAAVYNPDYETDWSAVADLDDGDTEIESLVVRRSDSSGDNIIEITQPFTIQEAYDVNSGDKVDNVDGENRTWQTTDVGLTQEQLDAMAEYYDDHQDYWENTSGGSSGGGGGGVDLGIDLPTFGLGSIAGVPTWLVLATGGGILLVASN